MDQATDLRALVRQVASSRAPSAARPRRIAVFGGKGGVGATTIALNLSVALAQQGTRCLLCDAAGGDASVQLGLEPRYTLADALAGNRSVQEVVVSGPAGVQILPGSFDLVRSHDATDQTWNRLLSSLPELTFQPETVVIDLGNRPDPWARQLWQAADRVLLISTVETAAIMSTYASIKLLNDPARSSSIALLLNRSPSETAADEAQRRLVHACRRFLGLPLRGVGVVPEDANVSRCAARGEAFVLAASACAASLALRQAARAMMNHATPRRPVAA
jgi:flagellar biosynthesis protein FlhG